MKEVWIKWDDGNCPLVDYKKEVKVKLRDGTIAIHPAGEFRWQNYNGAFDIAEFCFPDDAPDNWVDVAAFKSCPVDPEAVLEFKNTDMNITYTRVAKDYNSWGCSDEGMRFFRIIKEEKKDEDGWIEWHGGECPVDPHGKVLVKFRGAGGSSRGESLTHAGNYCWTQDGSNEDIIAYKIVKEEEEPKKPTKTLKVLTKEGLELQEEFESLYGTTGNCSCHTGNPPCSSCTHPGHPIALGESEDLWRTVEVNEEEITVKSSKPVDLLWGSW